MNWRDHAIVLGRRRFGENGLILDVLTKERGRQSGLVHGGASRRRRAQYEAGNTLDVSWTGRLEEQLGRFDLSETARERTAHYLEEPLVLNAIHSVTEILRACLKEGDATGSDLYDATELLLDSFQDEQVWPVLYVRWELGVLSALGFGLDLETCAITGAPGELTHVSPKSGRAVCGAQAPEYLDRLLPLPSFLSDTAMPIRESDLIKGLTLTGFFLREWLFAALHKEVPEVRQRLVSRLSDEATQLTTPRSL